MSFTIAKGSACFKYGMSSLEDLDRIMKTTHPLIGLAFCGRSNVGKSSLINTLFGKSTARVSKTPGRTREINIFTFKILNNNKPADLPYDVYLFDLPGHGHASVSKDQLKHWQHLMETFFRNAGPSILTVNMQDSRHPHTDSDQLFDRYIKSFQLPTTLVFNKMDKLKTQKERHALDLIKPILIKKYKWVRDIHFVSAEKRDGVPALESDLLNFLLGIMEIHE